jgi:hypothetical protein
MEQEGTETSCKESDGRIKTDQQGYKDSGTEGHEHELNADYRTLQWG